MSDKLKVEVELDLTDLHRYVQISDDDWSDRPVTITEAVVAVAARQIIEQALDRETLTGLRETVKRVQNEVIREHVEAKIVAILAQGVQRTNDYGAPIGDVIPLTDLIDQQIKKALTVSNGRSYDGRVSVVDQVIRDNVSARLTTDLNAAFLTARQAMLDAAQEAGAKAIRAAVAKAVG